MCGATSDVCFGPKADINWSQHQTATALNLQKAILESCEHASRAWIDRVQSEMSLWSDFASKMSATKSIPEAFETYTKCVSQRMQMAADDPTALRAIKFAAMFKERSNRLDEVDRAIAKIRSLLQIEQEREQQSSLVERAKRIRRSA
jgi:hypothetical protein